MVRFANTNLFLIGFGLDVNGNGLLKLRFGNQRAFSISLITRKFKISQYLITRLNLMGVHSLNAIELAEIENECINYIEKYGSKNQRILLKLHKD